MEAEASLHVPIRGPELDCSQTVRQAQAAPIGPVDHLLDPRNYAACKERDRPQAVEGHSVWQSQREHPTVLRLAVHTRPRTQGGWRRCEDLLDRRVELAHALKARGKADLSHRQR